MRPIGLEEDIIEIEYIPVEFDMDNISLQGDSIKSNNLIMTDFKRHLISASITFISTFITAMAIAISVDSFTFTKEALFSLSVSALVAGVRGVAKLIVEWQLGVSK